MNCNILNIVRQLAKVPFRGLIPVLVLLLVISVPCFAKDAKNSNDIKSKRMEELKKVASGIRNAVAKKDTRKLLQFVNKDGEGSFEGAHYSYTTMVKDFNKKGIFYCTTFDTDCLRRNYTGQTMVVGSQLYGDGEISVREFFAKYNKKISVKIRLDKGTNKDSEYSNAYISYTYFENKKSRLTAGCSVARNPSDKKWYFAGFLFDPE
jgi:hypothetical protein